MDPSESSDEPEEVKKHKDKLEEDFNIFKAQMEEKLNEEYEAEFQKRLGDLNRKHENDRKKVDDEVTQMKEENERHIQRGKELELQRNELQSEIELLQEEMRALETQIKDAQRTRESRIQEAIASKRREAEEAKIHLDERKAELMGNCDKLRAERRTLEFRDIQLQQGLDMAAREIERRHQIQTARLDQVRSEVKSLAMLLKDEILIVNQMREVDKLPTFLNLEAEHIDSLLRPGNERALRNVLDTLRQYYASITRPDEPS
jgi:chromosome segregation ATPase